MANLEFKVTLQDLDEFRLFVQSVVNFIGHIEKSDYTNSQRNALKTSAEYSDLLKAIKAFTEKDRP